MFYYKKKVYIIFIIIEMHCCCYYLFILFKLGTYLPARRIWKLSVRVPYTATTKKYTISFSETRHHTEKFCIPSNNGLSVLVRTRLRRRGRHFTFRLCNFGMRAFLHEVHPKQREDSGLVGNSQP
jgi:hypothetical protein